MKRNTNSTLGSLHPVLFFAAIYSIALFFAFFVCRTVYSSLNAKDGESNAKVVGSTENYSIKNNSLTATVYK